MCMVLYMYNMSNLIIILNLKTSTMISMSISISMISMIYFESQCEERNVSTVHSYVEICVETAGNCWFFSHNTIETKMSACNTKITWYFFSLVGHWIMKGRTVPCSNNVEAVKATRLLTKNLNWPYRNWNCDPQQQTKSENALIDAYTLWKQFFSGSLFFTENEGEEQ